MRGASLCVFCASGKSAARMGFETLLRLKNRTRSGIQTIIPSCTEVIILKRLELGARLRLALTLPWKILFNSAYAYQVSRAEHGSTERDALTATPPDPATAMTVHEAERDTSAALQLLAILQREGRFIDFLQEDVGEFSDNEIGAAARIVHEGCKRGLAESIHLVPVRQEQEGEPVTLQPGFDPQRNRITGHVVGEAPFSGSLAHHGWLAEKIQLPTLSEGHDPSIITPAEIEL